MVSKAFVVLWMVFFHIVDDYYLQGWLASAKQKKWWEENAPQPLYKHDYIWSLLMHGFSWSFMVMLPIAAIISFDVGLEFLVLFFFNVFAHALTDDLKANRNLINLWQDQLIHFGQIFVTAFFLLRHCLEAITGYLDTLGLTLNGKTQIFPFKNGINYLGFHTYITEDGHCVRKLKNQNKRNAQKKYVRMARLVAAGKLPEETFRRSFGAWKNHISHGNCYHLGRAMDRKINDILREGTVNA